MRNSSGEEEEASFACQQAGLIDLTFLIVFFQAEFRLLDMQQRSHVFSCASRLGVQRWQRPQNRSLKSWVFAIIWILLHFCTYLIKFMGWKTKAQEC